MFLRHLKPTAAVAVGLLFSSLVKAVDDIPIYTDGALASGWENWSWGSTFNFAATDIFEGSSSIAVTSEAWSAFSVKLSTSSFPTHAGLRFSVAVSVGFISYFPI